MAKRSTRKKRTGKHTRKSSRVKKKPSSINLKPRRRITHSKSLRRSRKSGINKKRIIRKRRRKRIINLVHTKKTLPHSRVKARIRREAVGKRKGFKRGKKKPVRINRKPVKRITIRKPLRKIKRIPPARHKPAKRRIAVKGARKTRLRFLDKHNVPYLAYTLPHKRTVVNGELVVGINAKTLEKLMEDFRKGNKRGINFGRLIINYELARGKGKKRLKKAVGTSRLANNESGDWQDLLNAFQSLSLTLYGYDAVDFGEEKDTDIRIIIKSVVLELINVQREESINV